jgi:hypothetical protein
MVPLNMRFDGEPNIFGSNIVRMPKLFEGAPYSYGFRVRFEDDSYRNFSVVENMRWRIKLRPSDKLDLMVLTKANGNFTVTNDASNGDLLTFKVHASDWEGIVLPRSPNHMEMDDPFAFIVEFLNEDGVVTERFAQGSGLISTNLV